MFRGALPAPGLCHTDFKWHRILLSIPTSHIPGPTEVSWGEGEPTGCFPTSPLSPRGPSRGTPGAVQITHSQSKSTSELEGTSEPAVSCPFCYRWGNRSSDRLRGLRYITELVSWRPRTRPLASGVCPEFFPHNTPLECLLRALISQFGVWFKCMSRDWESIHIGSRLDQIHMAFKCFSIEQRLIKDLL